MNVTRLDNRLLVVTEEVGVSAYDFNFELHFSCSHPYQVDGEEVCVLRIGPIVDYEAEFKEKMKFGLRPVNSPEQHALASELEQWYPLIEEYTPRSRVFDQLPRVEEIEADFEWPVFLKGSRQTSKHNPDLAVIKDRLQYEQVARRYRSDPILHWQKPVVREFVSLQPVPGRVPGKVQPSVEYRSFWWHGACVGWGRYWYQLPPYECSDVRAGLAMAAEVAKRLQVPFLVVDFAKTSAGEWTVIECNDAQESGYVGVQPAELWRNVLATVGG
ncbi:ATP-grasp domain-containing protein [Eleftheria terrae]|uniref:ATP-grasp domain-containing protein n=1 Tax=Eleftheria terrae TaxID=1597781 RepID=UPI00263AB6F5|nr:ATP-grasp domain-containing protein [Eleftheria terrae]WKB50795.1 ATP-grasp domain-containing protein [Eleftheria terrae]